jgi:uroporphyrinogen decarboxylase
VDHAMAVARKAGLAQDFRRATHRMAVASVGPSCSEALRRHGLPVDVEPARPVMALLVTDTANKAAEILKRKRARGAAVEVLDAGVARPGDVLHQSLFLKACRREPTARTPIWLMRQAGRYMKEYRELRAKVGFLELCKNSDLCAEVTVDAAHRLGVDAAIIFSDLLMLVEPLGFELSYGKDQGPQIGNPFRGAADLKRLRPVTCEESMAYALDAIRKTRLALKPDIPLIGFAGAPFTIASYVIEGGGSKNFIATKRLMTSDPATWNALLQMITTATIEYVNAQVAAGAQAVQIFDSWVGCLAPEDFRAYVLPHTRRLVKNITPGVPAIYFGTQTNGLLSMLKGLGADVIGVDWRIELDEAWEALGSVAIQGNLDPALLFSTEKEVRARARRILAQAAGRPGHIFNLGHGILPETPMDNVLALIEEVKSAQK